MTEQDILDRWDDWSKAATRVNAFARARGDFHATGPGGESTYPDRIIRNARGEFTVEQMARRIKVHRANLGPAISRLAADGRLSQVGKTETGARVYALTEDVA